MISPASVLLAVLFLAAIEANAEGDYFFKPVINIIKPNQEVKVDGCATPTMTLAFYSPINVGFFHTFSKRITLDDNSAMVWRKRKGKDTLLCDSK